MIRLGIHSSVCSFLLCFTLPLFAQTAATSFKFDFGAGKVRSGYVQVKADTAYTPQRGYGFEPRGTLQEVDAGTDNALTSDFITSDQPFSFSVAVPEGNYRVTVTLGDAKAESTATVRAETRRLMLEQVHTDAGQFQTRTFTVNVRRMAIGNTGESVEADLREWPTFWTWDDKLTVSFSGAHPAICAMEIAPATDATTVFLMSDSTVTDQMQGNYGTWGMNLPRWFNDKVAVANLAESGETVKGFRHEKRWDKILSMARPGDYILMQFGHNDKNRPGGTDAMWPADSWSGQWANKVSPADTDYKEGLKQFIVEAKAKGAIPVVVTPMTSVSTTGGFGRGPATAPGTSVPNNSLEAYAKNATLAAEEAGAAVIDLYAMSTEMHKALGPEKSRLAVMDGLHSNSYGGYLLSRCVIEGIKQKLPDLAKNLVADAGTFDPQHPQPLPEEFKIPVDPGQPGIPSFGFGGRRGARGTTAPAPARGGN
jgi:lysophospholipase L1-like esterase